MQRHIEFANRAFLGSGAAYTTTLLLCIGATQDKAACLDVYADSLAAI